jgi:hypothetical protein
MAPKPLSELTQHEIKLLAIAAIFSAILQHVSAHPPTPAELSLYNVKVQEELVSAITVIAQVL